ncbi:nucleotide-binding alpha-beta plait domain-containing protein [Tanacetum coccineum]
MGTFRSKEDDVQQISTSVFVTNFPDQFSAKDLWNTCKQYGYVVDAFIPNRKSKAGKRFGFVRFIKIFDVDRLVNNLCTVWVGRHKIHANLARFQRPPLYKNNNQAKIGESRHNLGVPLKTKGPNGTSNSYAHVVKSSQSHNLDSENIPAMMLDDSCLNQQNFNCWMGKVKNFESLSNLKVVLVNEGFDNIDLKYMGGYWVMIKFQSEEAKKTFQSNVGIEVPGWEPDFMEDNDDDSDNDDDLINDLKKMKNWKKQNDRTLISLVSREVGDILLLIYVHVFRCEKKMLWILVHVIRPQWAVVVCCDGTLMRSGKKDERFGENLNPDLAIILVLIIDNKVGFVGDVEIVNKRANVVRSLQELENLQSLEVAQKSKIKWAIEGDVNSNLIKLSNWSVMCSKMEIKRGGLDYGYDKSPGPMVSRSVFYRSLLGNILRVIVENSDANMVKDFRPISLIGSMYKIIAKILANRLVLVLGDLVNEVQSAFIADRQILDVPMKILQRMESIRSYFFNGSDPLAKKPTWVKWTNVLASKEKGGLGISSLYALNRASGVNECGLFPFSNSSYWRTYQIFHGDHGNICNQVKRSLIFYLVDIVKAGDLLKNGVKLLVSLTKKSGKRFRYFCLGRRNWLWDVALKICFQGLRTGFLK